MENLENHRHGPNMDSVDLSKWLMPTETVQITNSGVEKGDRTVQSNLIAKYSDYVADNVYRTTLYMDVVTNVSDDTEPPTTSTKGPETMKEFRGSGPECSGPTDTVCDSHRYLSRWLMPENPMESMEETCHGVDDICGQMGSFKGPDPGHGNCANTPWLSQSETSREYVCETSLHWKNEDEQFSAGLEWSGPSQDSHGRENIISEWLAPIGPMEEVCRGTNGLYGLMDSFKEPDFDQEVHTESEQCCDYSKWLVQSTECKSDLSRWLLPSDPWKMDQSGRQCGPGEGQNIFGNLETPKWQSTPSLSGVLPAQSVNAGDYNSLLVESMEHEIKDLKEALSRKNEQFLSLENDFEILLNKLDESEQKRIKSERKASNTIEAANGEIEIANNYIEMLKKQVQEKDEQILVNSLQKKLTPGKPKRSRMSAQSVKEKVKSEKSSLEQGATSSPSGGESGLEMSHTLSEGISVSDKQDGPGLSKSDTDLNTSCYDRGKPAVKIKHSSFSSYLDKKRETDADELSQIRYYIKEATHMMEGLKQSPDPNDLVRVKKLEEVIQHLNENRSVLEGATSMKD